MREEILVLLESFIVEQWGRLVFDKVLDDDLNSAPPSMKAECNEHTAGQIPVILTRLASSQQIPFDDLVYAFGRYSFGHYASKVPRYERLEAHPKKFLMAMHKVLSFDHARGAFAHFHYVDCAPEELVMIYKSKQSFSSFVKGFIDGAAESFAYEIECRPIDVRDDISGCRFHLRFRGEV